MEEFDVRFLDGAHHAFSLTVGPRLIGFCERVLDTFLSADAPNDLADPTTASLW